MVRLRAVLAAVVAAMALVSCASVRKQSDRGPEPSFLESSQANRAGVALVLSGGAVRGYAHVGVIKALERHGLRPDLIVGSSAGSIVGALYASGMSAAELESAMGELGRNQFGDVDPFGLGLLPGSMGVIRGDRLYRFIEERVKQRRMEDFPIRFAAVATDLSTGETRIFNAGDVGTAVHASSAVPGVIAPAEIGGRLYTDGQVSTPIPVEVARRLGARHVIAIDVVYPPEHASPRTALGVVFQAFLIAAHRLKTQQLQDADAIITPDLGRTTGHFSVGDRDRLVAAGERAALTAIETIRPYFVRSAPR